MFRAMRRKNREIDLEAAESLLQNCRRGVLAVNGDGGYPYAVLVNYFYDSDGQKIYFHGDGTVSGAAAIHQSGQRGLFIGQSDRAVEGHSGELKPVASLRAQWKTVIAKIVSSCHGLAILMQTFEI